MTDLIIIGAGAAGLMAACAAAEAKLSCLLLEKRHRPGLKLLMCGNNRCNVSHAGTNADLLRQYGEHSGNFLKTAIENFTPQDLREWLLKNGIPTVIIKERIYPKSEKADDILHCFTDKIRDYEIPFCTNCTVKSIEKINGGYSVITNNFSIEARNVIVATGGISYPKTGSTGDGSTMAENLGLKIQPWQTALGAIDANSRIFNSPLSCECNHFPVKISIFKDKINGEAIGQTTGNLLLEKDVLRGTAIFDGVRMAARQGITNGLALEIDFFPEIPVKVLAQKLSAAWNKIRNIKGCLNSLGVDHGFCEGLGTWCEREMLDAKFDEAARKLKAIPVSRPVIHPVKEAIAAMGGIDISELNAETMEVKKFPGLYFIGEAVDAEGPTGGFNLHAAFATARLAVASIKGLQTPKSAEKFNNKDRRQHNGNGHTSDGGRPQSRSRKPSNPKSAWGKDFWGKNYRPR